MDLSGSNIHSDLLKKLILSFAITLCMFSSSIYGETSSKERSGKPSETPDTEVQGPNSLSMGGAMDVPVHAQSCKIEREIRGAARVLPLNASVLRSAFYASIEKFNVARGASVKKGQLIATTDTQSLKLNQRIYQDYVSFYEGQLKIVEGHLKIVDSRLGRLQILGKKGITPQSEIDAVEKEKMTLSDQRQQVIRGMEGMQKSVDDYTNQIRLANFYADRDGIVTQLLVDPRSLSGSISVMPGTMVARIEQPNNYKAEVQLMDIQVHALRVGMTAEVQFPDRSVQSGKITLISTLPYDGKQDQSQDTYYQANPADKGGKFTTYTATVEFQRPGPILPSGLLAHVRILVDELKAPRCLPWNAVEVEGGKAWIRAFKDKHGWTKQEIKIGRQGRNYVEVLSQISEATVVMSRLW